MLRITSLVLVVSLFLSSVALAQTGNTIAGDWSAVRNIQQGTKLVVKLKSGKTTKGRFNNASDTSLSLQVEGKQTELNKDDIQTVHEVVGKSAKTSTLIGLGVGAGGGAAIGAAGGDNDGFFISKSQAAGGFAILGAGAGALTGYLLGRGKTKHLLVYQAK